MTITRIMVVVVSAMAVTFLAASCGSDEAAGVTDGTAVEGTTWTLEQLAGEPVPDGVEVTLEYDGETIAGTGGCNQYSGSAVFADGAFTIGSDVLSTLMACEEPASTVERQYLETLSGATSFVVEGNTLRLSNDDKLVLGFDPSK